jgi:superfamily I DNA and/or RNA helicase
MRRGESFPRFTNEGELMVLQEVLSHARGAGDEHPSLTVLSPYARQVRKISQEIQRNVGSKLANLEGFSFPPGQKSWCNTVDSFQGSEADLVVVSLVRNNGFGGVRAALGFLADARRMNVLMSRAKWRLVVIGCLPFLQSVLTNPGNEEEVDLRFLDRLLSFFDGRKPEEGVALVSAEALGWIK